MLFLFNFIHGFVLKEHLLHAGTLWMWASMMNWKKQFPRANGQEALGQQGILCRHLFHDGSLLCMLLKKLRITLQAHLLGFLIPWLAYGYSDRDELRVKEETGAIIRCFPFDQPEDINTCLTAGNPASEVAIFAKSYRRFEVLSGALELCCLLKPSPTV